MKCFIVPLLSPSDVSKYRFLQTYFACDFQLQIIILFTVWFWEQHNVFCQGQKWERQRNRRVGSSVLPGRYKTPFTKMQPKRIAVGTKLKYFCSCGVGSVIIGQLKKNLQPTNTFLLNSFWSLPNQSYIMMLLAGAKAKYFSVLQYLAWMPLLWLIFSLYCWRKVFFIGLAPSKGISHCNIFFAARENYFFSK